MMEALVIFAALSIGMAIGFFIAGARRRVDGVDGHVLIDGVWREVDGHGRVVIRPEEKP